MLISIILPCRNEEATIGTCIAKIKKTMQGMHYEIIVSDSSNDRSRAIAKQQGARVIYHGKEGYGNAIRIGLEHAKGDYLVIGDADNTYDFEELPHLLACAKPNRLVLGSRFKGTIFPKAMKPLHRYVGNPLFSIFISCIFGLNITDAHSGLRVFHKSFPIKNLRTKGMEFASEMLIQAKKQGVSIKEVPISYYPRKGISKLSSFSDGWRHLRFILLHVPTLFYMSIGSFLFGMGILSFFWFGLGSATLFAIPLTLHPLIGSIALMLIGYQIIFLGLFYRIFRFIQFKEGSVLLNAFFRRATIGKVSILGICLIGVGCIIGLTITYQWIVQNFSALNAFYELLFASTLIILGAQTLIGSFMLSALGIKT